MKSLASRDDDADGAGHAIKTGGDVLQKISVLWVENKRDSVIQSRPIHFMAFAVSGPICKSGLEPASDERVTVFVEEVTCNYCLSVISRLLANRRNRDTRDNSLQKIMKKQNAKGDL